MTEFFGNLMLFTALIISIRVLQYEEEGGGVGCTFHIHRKTQRQRASKAAPRAPRASALLSVHILLYEISINASVVRAFPKLRSQCKNIYFFSL